VESKLEQLKVSCIKSESNKARSQDRLASNFFTLNDIFGQNFVVFNVPAECRVYILRLSGISGHPIIIDQQATVLQAISIAPLLVRF